MTYRFELERRAHKALGRLAKRDRVRVVAAIDALAEDPRPAGCVPVRAAPKGTYHICVGGFRVIYVVLDDAEVIIVARVARRSETAYRKPG